jgi:hypothetical protein
MQAVGPLFIVFGFLEHNVDAMVPFPSRDN